MKKFTKLFLCTVVFGSIPSVVHSADIIKANNATALNVGTSWVGGNVPGSGDVAVWDNTITANRSTALGGNLSFQGLRFANPGGTSTLMSLTGSGGATLTLGSSGIDMSASTVDVTISSALLDISTNQTWTVASGRVLSLGSSSSNNTGLSSTQLTLAGPGDIALNTTGKAFGDTTLALTDGIRLRSSSATGRTLTNNLELNGNIGIGGALVSGAIALEGNLNVGSAIRTINLRNSVTDASANTLHIRANSQISGTGTLVLENGNVGGSSRVLIGASGSGVGISSGFTVGHNVVVFFNQTNVFTNSSDLTVNGSFRMGNLSSAVYANTVRSLSGSGTIDAGVTTGTSIAALTIDGGAATSSTTFSGAIVDGAAGRVSISKTGSTTQVLSGSNTYTGQTQINGGTLLINGSKSNAVAVAATGYGNALQGHIQVASGATLGGNGSISGNNSENNSNLILVQSGGILAPGNSIGTLTLDGADLTGTNARVLNMASGAIFNFELAGNGTDSDQIHFWNYANGDLLLNNNTINFSLLGPVVADTYTVDLFRFFSDGGSTAFSGTNLTSGLVVGTLDPSISSASINYSAGAFTLTYTVIPEPSTGLLLLGAAGALALLRRRRA